MSGKHPFQRIAHKQSLNVSTLNSTFPYSQQNPTTLSQTLGQQAIQHSLAFARNQADHIVAEAQSLKSRQISRGLVKINQSKYQLQKLEKQKEQIGRQNQLWQQIHRDNNVTSTKRAAGSLPGSASAKVRSATAAPLQGADSESEGSGGQDQPKAQENLRHVIAKQLEGIIANCTIEEMRGLDHMRLVNQDMRAQRIYDQEFDRVQEQMKDIETTQPALMSKDFNYREVTLREQDRESEEVTKEFRKTRMDTGRPEIGWERAINIKRRQRIIKEIKMVNKGKGMD